MRVTKSFFSRSLFVLSALRLASGARLLAAEDSIPPAELDLGIRRVSTSSLNSSSKISESSAYADFSTPLAGSRNWGSELDLQAEISGFHFYDFNRFVADTPPPASRAKSLLFQPTLAINPSANWSFITSLVIRYSAAEHANVRKSTIWGGSVAGTHQISPNLKLGIGFSVEDRMSGRALALPFPVIDWRISSLWSLQALDGESGRLSYHLAKQLFVFGKIQFQTKELRFADEASIPSGSMRYEAYPTTMNAEYHYSARVTLLLTAGWAVDQRYRFASADGRSMRVSNSHSPRLAAAEIDINFR